MGVDGVKCRGKENLQSEGEYIEIFNRVIGVASLRRWHLIKDKETREGTWKVTENKCSKQRRYP